MIKAYLIISTEYELNYPSIFLLENGNYYGCKIYPRSRNYPKEINYWVNAICSDSDRYFKITEVELDKNTLLKIIKLQNVIDANESMIHYTSYPTIKREWKIRKGKKYEEWKKRTDKQQKQISEEYQDNSPFETARSKAFKLLKNLLLFLKNS